MKKTRVYDWPTRLFHGSFAAIFLGAFFIAKTIDDESPVYAYHMLLGFMLAAAVVLRIVWGLIGSRYARFSSFQLRPSALLDYFKNLLLGRAERRLGHNAASSWAALIMMALALGLALTGYMMTTGGNKEMIEEIHELLANAFILVAIAHVGGVLLHTLRHRDGIALSMIHGGRKPVEGEPGIERTHAGAGLIYLALLGTVALHLGRNYDAPQQSLNLFGSTLQLGEAEEGKGHGHSGNEHDDD